VSRASAIAPRGHAFFLLSAAAVLMSSIDNTIVAVAIPELTRALGAPLSWISWTLTVYQLVQVVMLPVAGKLSDSLGRTRLFVVCVTIFTVSSLLCGMAPNVGLLIVFRALQAIGGGGLMPSAVGIIADQYRERRAQAVGLISSVMPIGTILGPNLGGFLLQNWSWRALFWVNVPIGVLVVGGVLLLAQPSPRRQTARNRLHVDLVGLLLYATAIVGVTYAMTLVANEPSQARDPLVWGLAAASVVLGGVFVWHVRRAKDPVLDYTLLARNPFLAANLYNFFFGAAALGFFSFVPYYAVIRYHLSAFESGAVLTPRALTVVASSVLSSMYVIRLGYRLPMLLGMLLVVVSLLLLARDWPSLHLGPLEVQGFWQLAGLLAIGGMGMGISNPASNNASLELAPHQAAAMTGIRSMFRLTGGALSIAAIVLALSFFPDQAAGFSTIYVVLAAVVLASAPLVFLIPDGPRRKAAREPVGGEQRPAGQHARDPGLSDA
jgi:EmrB/QacA subfamily drug resistance transporter